MYKTQNLINGNFRDSANGISASIKNVHGKDIITFPDSTDNDLSLAIKVANKNAKEISEKPIKEIINAIKKTGRDYLTDKGIRRLIAISTGSPISYIDEITEKLREWMMSIEYFIIEEFGSIENYELGVPYRNDKKRLLYLPAGITGIILAGDEVALAAFVIVQAILSRNPVVVRPSTQEVISMFELAKGLHKNGLEKQVQIVHWKYQTSPQLVTHLIKMSDQIIVFGNDETVNDILTVKDSDNNLVDDLRKDKKIISYTSGKSACIVMEDADLDFAVNGVLAGATSNRGNECTTTKKVYVAKEIYSKFIHVLEEKTKKMKFGNPLSEETQIGSIGHTNVKIIQDYAKQYVPLYSNFQDECMNLLLLEDRHNNTVFTLKEMPGPTLSIIEFDNIQDCIEKTNTALNGSTATVMSVFSNNQKYTKTFSRNLMTHKIHFNKSTTYIDFTLPHHGRNLLLELLFTKIIDMG